MNRHDTWADHARAVRLARIYARQFMQRQRVIVEHGTDEHGPYHFRILPAEVAEPCS